MRYGIEGNGIAVGIEELPQYKKPCLTVYPDYQHNKDIKVKVATFTCAEDALWFIDMMVELVKKVGE